MMCKYCHHYESEHFLGDIIMNRNLDDIVFLSFAGWSAKYPDVELFKQSEYLNKLVAEGKFGLKTGEGFYKYDKK